jgi:hypothetical protein
METPIIVDLIPESSFGFVTPDRPTRSVLPPLQKRSHSVSTPEPRVRRRLEFPDSDDESKDR